MSDTISGLRPGKLLLILLLEFLGLVFLLLCFRLRWLFIDRLPVLIGDVMPLIVPWGGALGGVCIGLVGLASHWSKWGSAQQPSSRQGARWNAWYLTVLPLGAAFGTVAALIVVLFLGTVARTPEQGIDVSPIGAATLFTVAFIVGYQQDVFRRLVERVVEVLLGPGTAKSTAEGLDMETAKDFGNVSIAGGLPETRNVEITNAGAQAVTVGTPQVAVQGSGFAVTNLAQPLTVPANGSAVLVVEFRPTVPGPVEGVLTVTLDGRTRTTKLTGAGVT